jgi:cbb3-type cytochrome oxidase subunit 3
MLRLSDIVSHSGLSFYAEVALVLFLLVFLGVVISVMRPGSKPQMDAASRIPFNDEPAAEPSEEQRS